MDIIRLYYYTSVPLLTCNMLFYSITSLSASITSSQNVVKFISEHKYCDSFIFKNQIEELDLEYKLRLVETLILDTIKSVSANCEEFERTKQEIQHPNIPDINCDGFSLVEFKSNNSVLERINEPIKLSLIGTSEIIQNINALLNQIKNKIDNHNKSYVKKIISLSLQNELKQLDKMVKILDNRIHLLLEIMKLYMPNK